MSLVAEGLHYLLDIRGLKSCTTWPPTRESCATSRNDPRQNPALGRFRNSLAEILRE